ncbi:HAD family hydrolase [Salipiger abyssi]|uniref:phosphoglycolate phosphatase n=1 Tax=Salipiger abyssi TaxID=1250539 RepID=A0A1P8UN05_9RHOB|nr:HAD hydrolase-like protein [Salipiger abyssi]APZ50757.1 phosphoglycolate phosphatase [Salipiger abyssi]
MICLDFDGVIADTLGFWDRLCRQAAAEQGLVLPRGMTPFARLCPLTFLQLGADLGLDAARFDKRMAALSLEQESVAAPFPEMPACLETLAALAPLCVLSSSRTVFVRWFLSRHGLDGHFRDVLGGDRHPGKAAALRSMPQAVLMIGDAKSDIDAARQAGLRSVGVLWGWQDRSMLEGADYLAERPEELLTFARAALAEPRG